MKGLSRRTFLKTSGLATAAASAFAMNGGTIFGISKAFAQDAGGTANDDVQTIINVAATAELFASTHYLAAINGDLGLAEAQVNYLKAGFIAEYDHYELLVSLGAEPVVTEFYVPDGLFSDQALFSEITEVAETVFVAAYLAATRIFAEAGATPFAVTTAQIAGVEAEHLALVRQIGGRLTNQESYMEYTLANVSDAVPLVEPFLTGEADGFVGPVPPPTADEAAAIRAEADAIGYDSSVLPFAAM